MEIDVVRSVVNWAMIFALVAGITWLVRRARR
jgi:hypothetical protein